MLGLYGAKKSGYTSYFMTNETILDFNGAESGVGRMYWRNAIDDYDENVHLMGLYNPNECHMACLLSTGGVCWIFR